MKRNSQYTIIYRRSSHGEEGERICSDGLAENDIAGVATRSARLAKASSLTKSHYVSLL